MKANDFHSNLRRRAENRLQRDRNFSQSVSTVAGPRLASGASFVTSFEQNIHLWSVFRLWCLKNETVFPATIRFLLSIMCVLLFARKQPCLPCSLFYLFRELRPPEFLMMLIITMQMHNCNYIYFSNLISNLPREYNKIESPRFSVPTFLEIISLGKLIEIFNCIHTFI